MNKPAPKKAKEQKPKLNDMQRKLLVGVSLLASLLLGVVAYRVFLDLRTHRLVDRAMIIQERSTEELNPPKDAAADIMRALQEAMKENQ